PVASVHPEPGSNSSLLSIFVFFFSILNRAEGKGRRAVLFLVAFTETVAGSCLTCSVEHRISEI
ncbi:MAG: hypothetical protein K2M71_08610, partial [Duncaniella sp.]|nr:hypothetical protein [Duncaniella sp.]